MTINTTINEFLVRWDESGKLQGMHVAYMTTYAGGDGSVRRWMEDPRPIALTDADTLATVAASINTGALASINGLNAQVAQLEADKQAAFAVQTQLQDQLEADKQVALTTQARLQEQLDAANARIAEFEAAATNTAAA